MLLEVVKTPHTEFVWKHMSEGFSQPQPETWTAALNCPSNLVVDNLVHLFCTEAPDKRTMHKVAFISVLSIVKFLLNKFLLNSLVLS